MSDETQNSDSKEQLDRRAVVERVRQFVGNQLGEGASAPDLSFALAYIATDLGLTIAPEALRVFPVVLEGISEASLAHSSAAQNPAKEGNPDAITPPVGSSIH